MKAHNMLLLLLMLICALPVFSMIHKIGGYDTPDEAYSVKVYGNLAYVANGFTGLLIFDVTNPRDPILLGQSIPFNHAREVVVVGNYAYVSCQEPGLMIFNISDPQNPLLVGSYDAPHTANSLDVVGNLAYLADYQSGMLIVDVSNPQSPQLIGSYDTPNYAGVVKVVDNVAYIADESTGLVVVDVSNPQTPQLLGTYDVGWSSDLTVCEGKLYIICGTFMKVYDTSSPQNLQLIGTFDVSTYPGNIHVEAEKAYISFANANLDSVGLIVLDVSETQNIQLLDIYETVAHQFANSCDVVGNLVYLASGGSGLQVLELSDEANPFLLGTYLTPDYASSFEVSNGTAYIASTESGLLCVDVSNPQNPHLIGSFSTDGETASVDVEGNLAYVTNINGSMQIINVSNPQAPVLVGSYGDSPNTYKVKVSDGIAYICAYDLLIVDVNNPQNPQLLGSVSFDDTFGVSNIVVQDDLVYATVDLDYGVSWLYIIDVSNPHNPQILGNYNSAPTFINSIAVTGNTAFIALGSAGLQVLNIANPNVPTLVSTILPHTSSIIRGVYITPNLMFVSDWGWNQIDVYEITDTQAPSLIFQYSWNLETRKMYLENGILYTTNGYNGLNILDYYTITPTIDPITPIPQDIYITNYPNPFNPSTTIQFKNPASGIVALDIYNVKGQKVKRLLNEFRKAAMYQIPWDGTDDNGRAVGSGIYYAEISTSGKHSVKKLVLIK